ncbi:MAG TPA: cytochrome C oxidase subunit IV family protein [Gemmatimonadales bacterium]
MDSHAAAPQGHEDAAHAHPGPGLYVKIGIVLFVLTGLEVAAYEIAHRPGALGAFLKPIVVPVLLLLSAFKFALVAMFYMHLKQDSKLLSGLFVFPLIIATVVIVSLIALFIYHYTYQRGML